MNRILLLFSFLFLFGSLNDAKAQNSNLGIKAGINPTAGGERLTAIASNYQIGVFAQHEFNSKIELQVELNYSLSELRYQESQIELKELQIPLTLRYKVQKPFYLQAGAQYNYIADIQQGNHHIGEEFDANHFNGLVGFGFDLPSGFDFSVRYLASQNVFSGYNQFSRNLLHVSIAFDFY